MTPVGTPPVDFLTKPFSDADLMAAIRTAIAQDREKRLERSQLGALKQRYLDLTPRERELLPLVVSGLLNKQAAAELGVSEVTLEIHRRNVMQKMDAASLADLVRIAGKLQIPVTHSCRDPRERGGLGHRKTGSFRLSRSWSPSSSGPEIEVDET